MTTFARTISLLAVPVVAALSLSACGSGHEAGSGRPTTDQLVSAMTGNGKAAQLMEIPSSAPSSAIQCIAQKLEASKLSDAALRAIVNGDDKFKESSSDDDALDDVSSQVESCVTS